MPAGAQGRRAGCVVLPGQCGPASLRPVRAGVVDGYDREGFADAAEDAVHLVAGCRGDAEHVETAVNEPEP